VNQISNFERTVIQWLFGAVVLFTSCVLIASMGAKQAGDRPVTATITIASTVSHPSAKNVKLNQQTFAKGQVLPLTHTGPAMYLSHTDRMAFELTWYDLLASKTYSRRFDLQAKQLSSIGDDGNHVEVTITTGAGGDLTITTPNPQALRLAGLDRQDEITDDIAKPVVMAQYCATPMVYMPRIHRAFKEDLKLEILEAAMFRRNVWLKNNEPDPSRCAR
jgi:hypothetical protein